VASKYDPLRDYLAAARERAESDIVMTFDEIDQIVVEGLPASARSGKTWWENSQGSGAHVRAWRAAGWTAHADLTAQTVTFTREPGGTLSNGLPAPSVPSGEAHEADTTWRSMVPDIVAGSVAMIAAGVAAFVALEHLPWGAITLLCVSAAAVAFVLAQAIASWKTPVKAIKWLSAAMALVLLTILGGLVYHVDLDPSTRPAALPFTISVSVDPTIPGFDQGCRQVSLPAPWYAPGAPSPLTQDTVNAWEKAQHGVDGHQTFVTIILQGTSDQAVTIQPPQVEVRNRAAALNGPAVEFSGGCGGVVPVRRFAINLDADHPAVTYQDGTSLGVIPSGSGSIKEAAAPVISVSATDPEYFLVSATAAASYVHWFLELQWQSMGRSGTVQIGDGSASVPFATTAVRFPGPKYYLNSDATWLSAP
jgi:hypothetical protein